MRTFKYCGNTTNHAKHLKRKHTDILNNENDLSSDSDQSTVAPVSTLQTLIPLTVSQDLAISNVNS